MTTWEAFAAAEPDLARSARERLDAYPHKTLATLRADGAPRISGVEAAFWRGELWIGGMPGGVKSADLRRDGRMALHSGTGPGGGGDGAGWDGDAKVSGVAVEADGTEQAAYRAEQGAPPGPFDLFRVDVTEVVTVRLGRPADHLVIESWHPDRGHRRVERR